MRRFTATERVLHWIHAAAFGVMLASGVTLYLPALAGVVGSREAVTSVHLFAVGGWIGALLGVCALGNRHALRKTLSELEWFDADDGRWLRRRSASQGRFNAGQKLHAIVQTAFAVLFFVSGTLLLLGEHDTALRLPGTIVLHDGLTVAATVLVAGHIYMALARRTTRPALRGMIFGTIDAAWARTHHSKWTPSRDEELARRGPLDRRMSALLLVLAIGVLVATVILVPATGDGRRAAGRGSSGEGEAAALTGPRGS
ncbi:cytochrome b/b6 domain-containing protein [Conexibacter sp. DBS9H8]|uniref:cytochrome b/b6 domain-containing protein n=1 Tax=Conexibacter sp. DBS9H8 TaxID=2937801 RepID=UPI00200DE8C2|nr:cytochrome b/b6 domain-containing protein [Conexibacter sp. DBS9H8]